MVVEAGVVVVVTSLLTCRWCVVVVVVVPSCRCAVVVVVAPDPGVVVVVVVGGRCHEGHRLAAHGGRGCVDGVADRPVQPRAAFQLWTAVAAGAPVSGCGRPARIVAGRKTAP